MAIHTLGRGACEYLPELKMLVSYWPMSEFADDEWDAYVAIVRSHAVSADDLRVLSWNHGNATPRPEQQKRMGAAVGVNSHKVAVVTRDAPNAFASSVLAFINPNIRTLSEEQWDATWSHLGLTPAEKVKVERALQQLRELVDRGHKDLRNTCELHVGRLVEIRIEAGYRDLADITDISAQLVQIAGMLASSRQLVLAIDWRKCFVMAEEAARQLLSSMRDTNERVERSGALLPVQSPVAMLQLHRMLRESQNPARRGFEDPEALIAYLSEVLTPEETLRLRAFVG